MQHTVVIAKGRNIISIAAGTNVEERITTGRNVIALSRNVFNTASAHYEPIGNNILKIFMI